MKKYYLIIHFLFLVVTQTIFAGTDGTIRGRITDVDQNSLPGAQVYIPELEKGAIADIDGNYIILNVGVGTYVVSVNMMGYRNETRKNVKVIMDQTVWLNFSLPVEAYEGEEVEVIGERPLVEKGTTSKKITIDKEAVEALPIRDMTELYSLQSGVVQVIGQQEGAIKDHEERGLQEIHVRGGRSGEIAYMIDGMYIRNPIYGGIGTGTRLNLFAIKEFDWQPGGFNAEYGDAMSAVSNMHTNSGKKKFSYGFKYSTSLVGASMGNEYDEMRGYNDYNLGFGGQFPGFLNKFYYWFSGQYTTYENYRVYNFDDNIYVDDPNDPFNEANRERLVQPWDREAGWRGFGNEETWDVFGKLTYKFSNRLRFNASYWQVAAQRKGFSQRYLYWDDGQNELFRDTYRYAGEMNHSLTSKTFYTLRVSKFVQNQFQGVRWRDSDSDGYPDWYEWRHPAGPNRDMSDHNNPFVVPYTISENADTLFYTKRDDRSGWYFGSTPGLYNWESAEEFTDKNGNGIWDEGEDYQDKTGDQYTDGQWDGPELVQKLYKRDGSYWLEPEMYQSYEPFADYRHIDLRYDQDPWSEGNSYGYGGPNYSGVNDNGEPRDPTDPFYYMPTWDGYAWEEGRVFGGHDRFYATSNAITDEIRLDVTSQITDRWKLRTGVDYKSHKLDFYEVKAPWEGEAAFSQTFAEFWIDSGPDGLLPTDADYEDADFGENNGVWDPGEEYRDSNDNGQWDNYREPTEFSSYIQNTFEVPWMVINAGVRVDAVNYNTEIWADTLGEFTPGIPWYFDDENENGSWDEGEEASTQVEQSFGANPPVIFEQSKWFYKISPRLGFSHVITDRATFTFNYGLYYQTPIYQNVFLQTNRLEDPADLFEEGEGLIGNATMNSSRTQSYSAAFNIQIGRHWAYTVAAWVKDTDQWATSKFYRSGVYSYRVFSNGDYGSAKGIDFTLERRGKFVNSMVQYTYSAAKGNSEYDWASVEGIYVDAPSQEFLMPYDRPHDLTMSFYTFLPFGISMGFTGMYQSGYPYTPMIYNGDTPQSDVKNRNTKRSPSTRMVNLSLSKGFKFKDFKVSMGLSAYNLLNIKNAFYVYPLTGEPDDPGTYYTQWVGLPDAKHDKSGSYYDNPWVNSSPRELNFNIRVDFR